MLTVPNFPNVTYPDQSAPDNGDWQAIGAAILGSAGVVSGCAVTASGTNQLAVAAGVVLSSGIQYQVAAGNVTIANGDASHPRFDLVVADATGVASVIAGTPAVVPAFPTYPTTTTLLAAVYVPPSATTFTSANLTNKGASVTPFLAQIKSNRLLNDANAIGDTSEIAAVIQSNVNSFSTWCNQSGVWGCFGEAGIPHNNSTKDNLAPNEILRLKDNSVGIVESGRWNSVLETFLQATEAVQLTALADRIHDPGGGGSGGDSADDDPLSTHAFAQSNARAERYFGIEFAGGGTAGCAGDVGAVAGVAGVVSVVLEPSRSCCRFASCVPAKRC